MSIPRRTLAALARTTLLIQRDIFPTIDEDCIARALTKTRVRISAPEKGAVSSNGQTAIVTTAILCAQMGMEVVLDFSEATLAGPQPPLRGEGLRESLLDLTNELITPAVVGTDGDFTIALGGAFGGSGLALSVDDWAFAIDPSPTTSNTFSGKFPFGAGLGATAAAAEAFRFAMRQLGESEGVMPLREHPIRDALAARYAVPRVRRRPLELGWVDSISAGALATSALYILLRVPGLQMHLRLIDDDCGQISNLNRYLLLYDKLLQMPKAEALATYATERISLEPVPVRFEESSLEQIGELAPHVVVGVDDIPSRWCVQRNARGWIGVAATSHFEVVVSEHTPNSPCASCLHPYDDPGPVEDIPTVSFVSAFAGFLLAHRLLRSASFGARPSQTLAYPLNLAGNVPVRDMPLAPHRLCRVGCEASASSRVATV